MISDPVFYLYAVPAVFLVGLSKGGLGGAMALIGVPLMALAISPVQAAAIMLPILILMDIISLWIWRRHNEATTLRIMLPGAALGILIAWLTAAWVTEDAIRLIVGGVALIFSAQYFWRRYQDRRADRTVPTGPRPHRPLYGAFCGTLAGFTSFVSHAGGPPYQLYTLPLRHEPKAFIGASVRFFAVVNALKVVPYFALGEFDATNLKTAAVLLPLAVGATVLGAVVVRRIRAEHFYPLMYAMVLVTAFKLIYDGLGGL
ncbi:sulfite exporter TauE/SafE family protein [Pseudohoeflea coraliihabitans]|uniref:Probable membrane transporter protein n=1 Tax=Pseudohoeflea coraliihabitans TaxID=2860393 RepID=A0ABS6WPG8_9HYPH|nr:sulfite exporter TauE/SafE family protein [Pseudohoeflea sp. DP4N28-3]MBW3097866.1 sulfite exporter TauE/SafE family protein [Pseudohoeflea sp. DP4N28-3]